MTITIEFNQQPLRIIQDQDGISCFITKYVRGILVLEDNPGQQTRQPDEDQKGC